MAARSGLGVPELETQLVALLRPTVPSEPEGPWVTSARHDAALRRTAEALARARAAAGGGLSPEFVAVEVREALDQLGGITGESVSDELLAEIFSKFCIGK